MTTATSSVNLGSRSPSGRRNKDGGGGGLNPTGTADVTITINTANVTTRGDFLEACKQIADHLSGYLK